MKTIQRVQYERGDHVMVTTGYNKGMVGIVVSHHLEDQEVEVVLANSESTGPRRESYYSDDDDYDSNYFNEKSLKYITKEQYNKGLVDKKILRVEGLPVALQAKGKSILIGDNVVTQANAKKIADFINKHTKGKKK